VLILNPPHFTVSGAVVWRFLRLRSANSKHKSKEIRVAQKQLVDAKDKYTTENVLEMIREEERDTGLGMSGVSPPRRGPEALAFPSLELALTGPGMKLLLESGDLEPLLYHVRIVARASPEQKVQVVTLFIQRGLIVGMCGDGGNDCGGQLLLLSVYVQIVIML
jgi:hypothetical protein